MKLEIEITSKEIIKPSSPTPHHLHHYQLSFLDQVSPSVYNPLVLFYSSDNSIITTTNSHTICDDLKKSLQHVLTQYYPLAGRFKGNAFVRCNDEGVPFYEARVKWQLLEFIQNPEPCELNRLVPFELDNVTDIIFGVQFSVFECGGIAIGACLSHQIADGSSLFTFLNIWASVACGRAVLTNDPSSRFVSASLFPPKNTCGFNPRSGITKDDIISKRFVFNASAIESLRSKYSEPNDEKLPSRIEALSAFIWSRYVALTTSSHPKTYAVVHAVNLRPRMDPPLPPDSFGNYYRFSMTLIPTLESKEDRDYGVAFVNKVREQLKKVDKDYARRIQEGASEHVEFLNDRSFRVLVKGDLAPFSFTSLCRFPLYDADFGRGKPTWVGSPALTFKNLVVFVDAKVGGGIEAYVSLKVEDMAKFEADKEMLACVDDKWTAC